MGRVILIEFRLRDRPGVVQPVLHLISSFRFNISYISSQADGTDYQNFRMTSLNPVFTVGNQLVEGIRLHTGLRGKAANDRAMEMLRLVGINEPEKRIRQYPYELSGGMDWNVFLEERKAGNYDFCREGWLADFNDPINMLEMWTTKSGNNDCQFGRVDTAATTAP